MSTLTGKTGFVLGNGTLIPRWSCSTTLFKYGQVRQRQRRPCLFCRERISGDVIAAEVLAETNPAECEYRRKQGYVPELRTNATAVIPFTSSAREATSGADGWQTGDRA
jgi:hypothetical protein